MPTLVDELIITLGLDSRQFRAEAQNTQRAVAQVGGSAIRESRNLEEGLKRSQDQTTKRLQQTVEVGRDAVNHFNRVRLEVAAFFTALTGYGIQQFVKNVVASTAELGRMSTTIGISSRDLAAWQEAAKRTGGSAEGIAGSMLSLSQSMKEYDITSRSHIIEPLRGMGIQLTDELRKAKDVQTLFLEISEWMSKHTPQEAQFFGTQLGFDQGTINLLREGPAAVKKRLAEAMDAGVPDDAMVKKAQAAFEIMQKFEQVVTNLARELVVTFLPDLTNAVNAMAEWVKQNENWIKSDFVSGVRSLVEDIKAFVVQVDRAVEAVGGWKIALEGLFALWLGGKVVRMLADLAAITKGFGAAGAAVRGAGGGAVAGAAASGGLAALLSRLLPLAALLLTGPAGGEDAAFSERKNQEFLENRRRQQESSGGRPEGFGDWMGRAWGRFTGSVGRLFSSGPQPVADTSMSATQKAFLEALSGPESGGRYNVLNGGEEFSDFSRHPGRVGRGGSSTAAGRYQFVAGTWDEIARERGLTDFSPANQDRAAWHLAQREFRQRTGGDLEQAIQAGRFAEIAAALRGRWPSLPGGTQSNQTMGDFMNRLNRGQATQPGAAIPSPVLFDPSISSFLNSPPGVPRSALYDNRRSSTTSSEVHINGPIVVHTAATDADGIARGIGASLRRYAFVTQANVGLV